MNPEEMRERRGAMFSRVAVTSRGAPGSIQCHECGAVVVNEDAHFGFHMKVDNIDQRANAGHTH